MKPILSALGLAAVFVLAAAPARAELTLTLRDGRVTLVADNVTPRQILAEWARVGQVRLVNGDKVPGAPVTLRLTDVPERLALDIILRAAAGYMASPRVDYVAQASVYDRILVLPASTAVQASSVAASAPRPTPMVPSPSQTFEGQQGNEESDEPQPAAPGFNPYVNMGRPPQQQNFEMMNPAQGGAAPSVFPGSVVPQAQPIQPLLPQATPQTTPSSPTGAARPGQITPVPPSATTYSNPYNIGTPAGPVPEPDRTKYTNPYQPVPGPVKPPSD